MPKYIRDDRGFRWYYSARAGRIICADDRSDGPERANDGYACNSKAEGIALLRRYGYITDEQKKAAR